ncbi:MAG: cytochrome C [Xanthomonadaceae bacterium]|nr:cytochrome C [Xanthomonadaceae bacterium]
MSTPCMPCCLALTAALFWTVSAAAATWPRSAGIERGRYVVQIAGCNDCHTAGYAASGGKVPESQWLTGAALGWRGPWGTTYPSNLRRYMHTVSEAQWLQIARSTQYRPPMPWMSLHAMSDVDLRSVYRFVRHLGPAGEAAPTYVPPGARPQTPFVQFPAEPAGARAEAPAAPR